MRIAGSRAFDGYYELQTMSTSGHYFRDGTPQEVANVLMYVHRHKIKVRIWLGDRATGKVWPEEHDVVGTIAFSVGPCRVPLLIGKRQDHGGDAILTHCILRIDRATTTKAPVTLYEAPGFDLGRWSITPRGDSWALPYEVYHNSQLHAAFATERKAQRYVDFMLGVRYVQ